MAAQNTIKLACRYIGKNSFVEFKQGGIDLQFRAGKMQKFDTITSIDVTGEKISFHGLFFGDLFRKVEIEAEALKPIFERFKVRTLSHSDRYGTMYKDHALRELKVAAKGENIYEIFVIKRAKKAARNLKELTKNKTIEKI